MADKRTFYEVLGLTKDCSAAEIRSAYRKIALKHHPDRSGDPGSREVFIRATQAHEVLSDPARRAEYDRLQTIQEELRKRPRPRSEPEAAKATRPAKPKRQPRDPRATVEADLRKLHELYLRNRVLEAESLARRIVVVDGTQPMPYAVLGDIARSRGDFAGAAEMYAAAAQRDPKNPVYLRRYEELVATRVRPQPPAPPQSESTTQIAPVMGFAIILLGCAYVAVHQEAPVMPQLAPISTWTAGILVMLFLSGVAVGASFSVGKLVDRFETHTATEGVRLAPSVALLFVSVVNFWAAVGLFCLTALMRRAVDYSASRLIAGTVVATSMVAMASGLAEKVDPVQVLLWGGNLSYLGALCGWLVADSLRDSA